MASSAEKRAWVQNVLGVPVGRVLAGAMAGGPEGELPPRPAAQGAPDGPVPEPTQNWFTDAVSDLAEKAKAAVVGADPASVDRKKLALARLASLADPVGTAPEQAAALEKARAGVRTALADEFPTAVAFANADKAMDKIAQLVDGIKRKQTVADLTAANPEAGKQANAAFGKFARVLGTTPVTPEATQKATADKIAKRKVLDAAEQAFTAAKAMPAGSAREKALAKAAADFKAAKPLWEKADALEEAMLGQTSLTAALSNGPLSPRSGGGFKDPAVTEKLIEAYSKDARMADAAVTAASGAKFPGAIADQVGPMIDRAKAGFADKTGQKLNPAAAESYGAGLLKAGGQMGPAYFDRLPDYVASGEMFKPGAAGDGGANTWNGIAQNRSRKLAGALIKPDGSIDLGSEGAKNAVGNMLYHPDTTLNPTPGLTENVLKTLDTLKDPVTGPQASAVLKGVTAPTDPAGLTLVRGSLGKGPTDAVDANGARTAVLSSMLQPLDQGAVGSCFVTGPARKLRETQPIEVMKSYADLASKGTYKPAVGPALPAITNLPPGDDPLMRSYEYTAATAGARNADSIERRLLTSDTQRGTDLLKDAALKGVADKDKDNTWRIKQQKLSSDVAAALTFTYDSNAVIPSSSDGSSSKGRYRVSYKNKDITTQAEFQAAMLEIALASLGVTAESDEGKEVARIVNSPAFATAVCPRTGSAPWALPGGGFGEGTIESIYGTKITRSNMVAVSGTPAPAEGARTKEVLSGLLKQFRGSPAVMATIDTSGQHSFNALPNDPSLDALKGATDQETAAKIQSNLVDKGTAMKNTDLAVDRAQWLFDAAIKQRKAGVTDPALLKLIDDGVEANRPKAAMKPAALTEAVKAAMADYDDKQTETQTAKWKQDEIAASRPVTPQKEAEQKAKIKQAWTDAAATAAKNGLMKDLGAPEFKIADTNWGGATNHVYFVIAPDPATGEPQLWTKTEPPGTLSPAKRDWIDRAWQVLQ